MLPSTIDPPPPLQFSLTVHNLLALAFTHHSMLPSRYNTPTTPSASAPCVAQAMDLSIWLLIAAEDTAGSSMQRPTTSLRMSRTRMPRCGGCVRPNPQTALNSNPRYQVCDDPGQSFGLDKLQQRYDDAHLMVAPPAVPFCVHASRVYPHCLLCRRWVPCPLAFHRAVQCTTSHFSGRFPSVLPPVFALNPSTLGAHKLFRQTLLLN